MAQAGDRADGPREDSYDAVVIGSGLGGVSAAALLAKHGYKTLVAEQGEGVGGLAHAFKRDDYTFDSAIRVLAEGEMVEGLLEYLGVLDECKLLHIDHLYRAVFPDEETIFAPVGVEEFMEAHIRLFPDEEEGIRTFFGLRRQMFLETAQMPMQLDPRQLGSAMELAPTLFKYRTATLQQVLDEHLRDPKLKAMASALWPYMGAEPSRLSFFAYAQFIGVLVDGPYYCQGTFQSLVDAFVTALERNGGELAVRTPVTRIVVEDGRVSGVELEDGRTIRAPLVVSNADARHTFEDLIGLDQLPTSYVKRLQRLKVSASACVLYGATTTSSSSPRSHRTTSVARGTTTGTSTWTSCSPSSRSRFRTCASTSRSGSAARRSRSSATRGTSKARPTAGSWCRSRSAPSGSATRRRSRASISPATGPRRGRPRSA